MKVKHWITKLNIKGNNEKISDEKLNNLRKVGTGLVDQNNEFETDLIRCRRFTLFMALVSAPTVRGTR